MYARRLSRYATTNLLDRSRVPHPFQCPFRSWRPSSPGFLSISFAARWPASKREAKPRALAKEAQRVVEDDLANQGVVMSSPPHLEDQLRDRQRVAVAPVAGRVDHDPFRSVHLDHVGGPGGGALGDRIERHSHPVTGV